MRPCASVRMPFSSARPAASASAVSGAMPMPVRTRSAASLAAVGERGAGDAAARAGQPVEAGRLADLDAVASVQGAEVVGGGGRGDAGEDARRRFDQHDVEALLAQHRRGLEADVAAAHHQRPRAGRDDLGQRVGVAEVAHREHAGEAAALRVRQASRHGAGGERQEVPGQRRPSASAIARPARSIAATCGSGEELDAFGGVEARRAQQQPLAGELALEVALGERRALVGRRGLGADQRQAGRCGRARAASRPARRRPGRRPPPRSARPWRPSATFAFGIPSRPSICPSYMPVGDRRNRRNGGCHDDCDGRPAA